MKHTMFSFTCKSIIPPRYFYTNTKYNSNGESMCCTKKVSNSHEQSLVAGEERTKQLLKALTFRIKIL